MARTDEGRQLTQQHRADQLAIRASMLRDLLALWEAAVDPFDLSRTIGPFASAGAVLVRGKHRDSAAVGRRYFREFRIAEGIGAMRMPDAVEAPPVRIAEGTLRGAALKGIISARRRGFSPRSALQHGFTRASGSATSLTLNGGRETIRVGIASDEEALGWMRVTSGDPCHFCAIIASRAETHLFSSEKTADFQPHDHCSCQPEPMYRGSELPELNRRFREQWDQTGDVNAFRRLHEGRE